MSHPKNRYDREFIGRNKGIRRADGELVSCSDVTEEHRIRARVLRKNTTKLCSCFMCGNAQNISGRERDRKKSSLKLIAGCSSQVAFWAHNPEVAGSNPAPAI